MRCLLLSAPRHPEHQQTPRHAQPPTPKAALTSSSLPCLQAQSRAGLSLAPAEEEEAGSLDLAGVPSGLPVLCTFPQRQAGQGGCRQAGLRLSC